MAQDLFVWEGPTGPTSSPADAPGSSWSTGDTIALTGTIGDTLGSIMTGIGSIWSASQGNPSTVYNVANPAPQQQQQQQGGTDYTMLIVGLVLLVLIIIGGFVAYKTVGK